MANTYFDFKQFRIEQAACANKVSTDACVFGAWLARLIKHQSVLDVGCGSGLLSLMIAQHNASQITGIEIDQLCTLQAQKNLQESPFNQIEMLTADARTWESEEKFDWIISNPPFYNNTSKNRDPRLNTARQTALLGPKDWPSLFQRCSHEQSTVVFLLSNNDVLQAYIGMLNKCAFTHQFRMDLFDKAGVACKRVILFAKKEAFDLKIPNEFTYKRADGSYTPEFQNLLKDYYLYL